jgi:hypothetical protein
MHQLTAVAYENSIITSPLLTSNAKYSNSRQGFPRGLNFKMIPPCFADTEESIEDAVSVFGSNIEGGENLPKQKYRAKNKVSQATMDKIRNASNRVLVLKAYLDEAERDIRSTNWKGLEAYLQTALEQDQAFALLIDSLFPSNDELDVVTREAMSFEAQSLYLNLENLVDAAVEQNENAACDAYADLLLAYDRFLKAGNLYATYDPITSTEIFFKDLDSESVLRYDKRPVQRLDRVLFVKGPDMGKTGVILKIDRKKAVVKLDQEDKEYQEVKESPIKFLRKTLKEDDDAANLKPKTKKKTTAAALNE